MEFEEDKEGFSERRRRQIREMEIAANRRANVVITRRDQSSEAVHSYFRFVFGLLTMPTALFLGALSILIVLAVTGR